MTGFGASDPLPAVPAKVGLLNRQPTPGPGDEDYSSCPMPAIRRRISVKIKFDHMRQSADEIVAKLLAQEIVVPVVFEVTDDPPGFVVPKTQYPLLCFREIRQNST